MISRKRKMYNNRLKRSINKYTGGLPLISEDKYAFFVNKKKYIELFGEINRNKNAPSIKDIEKNFKLNGYYLKNNTNTLYLIGWDNLNEYNKDQQSKNYEHRVKSYNDNAKHWVSSFSEYDSTLVSGAPSINIDNIINIDDDSSVEQLLISKFNYDRIIPASDYLRSNIYKYTNYLNSYPTIEDSYLCVIIQVNYLKPNKYIYFIEKDIKIIKEQDEIDKKLALEQKKKFDLVREKIKKLEESPTYTTMRSELCQLWKNHINEMKQIKTKKDLPKKKRLYDIQKQEIINKYKIIIENEINLNKEISDEEETLENLIKMKEHHGSVNICK